MGDTERILTARGKRYIELDRLAYELGPTIDEIKLASLPYEEEVYVVEMAHLYMMYRFGVIDPETAKKLKLRNIKRCERIHEKLLYARFLKQREIICTKTFYREYKELTQLINEKSPYALKKALQIIDSLSGMYVLTKMYSSAEYTPEYIGQAVAEITDEKTADKARGLAERLKADIESGELEEFFSSLTDADIKLMVGRLPERDRVEMDIPEEFKTKI